MRSRLPARAGSDECRSTDQELRIRMECGGGRGWRDFLDDDWDSPTADDFEPFSDDDEDEEELSGLDLALFEPAPGSDCSCCSCKGCLCYPPPPPPNMYILTPRDENFNGKSSVWVPAFMTVYAEFGGIML